MEKKRRNEEEYTATEWILQLKTTFFFPKVAIINVNLRVDAPSAADVVGGLAV